MLNSGKTDAGLLDPQMRIQARERENDRLSGELEKQKGKEAFYV